MGLFVFQNNQSYKVEEIRQLLGWTHGQMVSLLKSGIRKATHSKPVKILGKTLNEWLKTNPEPSAVNAKSMAYLFDCPRLPVELQVEQIPAEMEEIAIQKIKEIGAIIRAKRPHQCNFDRKIEPGIREYHKKISRTTVVFKPSR